MGSKNQAKVKVAIRHYRKTDQAQLRWLYERTPPAGQVAYAPQPWDGHLEHIDEHYVSFWVAIHTDGERQGVVGALGLERVGEISIGPPVPDFIDTARPTVRIHEMRTAPELQRQGIGRQLLDAALEWSRGQRYELMILETTRQQEAAVAFYEATGFTAAGHSVIGRWDLVWFWRRL
jgi:GNAT superfamily N-acetyltransferase